MSTWIEQIEAFFLSVGLVLFAVFVALPCFIFIRVVDWFNGKDNY